MLRTRTQSNRSNRFNQLNRFNRLSLSLGRAVARVALLALVSGFAAPAFAEEFALFGTRYQAMGGAAVAVADDSQAAYWNPGALAFAQSWDVSLPIGVTAGTEGDIISAVEQLADFVDSSSIDSALQTLEAGGTLSQSEIQDLIELGLERIAPLGDGGQGVLGNTHGGLGLRHGAIALTGFHTGYFAADPSLDFTNLSIGTNFNAPGGRVLSPADQTLANQISNDTDFTQDQADELVFQARSALGANFDQDAQDILVQIAGFSAPPGSGGAAASFQDNQTGAFARGIATAQVGIAYGHMVPFFGLLPMLEDRIGVGANLKYIHGTVFNSYFSIQDDDIGNTLSEAFKNSKGSSNFGLDIGLKVRIFDWLHWGLVARNVNGPKFDAPRAFAQTTASRVRIGPSKYELEPQVRMGVAVNPLNIKNWTVSMDLDLTQNESQYLAGFKSRHLAAGTEFRLPLGPVRLDLRGGMYINTGKDAVHEPVITAGLGLRFWHLQFDIAGGTGTKFEDIDGVGNLPNRAHVSAMMLVGKKF